MDELFKLPKQHKAAYIHGWLIKMYQIADDYQVIQINSDVHHSFQRLEWEIDQLVHDAWIQKTNGQLNLIINKPKSYNFALNLMLFY